MYGYQPNYVSKALTAANQAQAPQAPLGAYPGASTFGGAQMHPYAQQALQMASQSLTTAGNIGANAGMADIKGMQFQQDLANKDYLNQQAVDLDMYNANQSLWQRQREIAMMREAAQRRKDDRAFATAVQLASQALGAYSAYNGKPSSGGAPAQSQGASAAMSNGQRAGMGF